MESMEKYRQYAGDCRRLAGRAAPKDKAVLLEIAEAWEQCAKDAAAKGEKTADGRNGFSWRTNSHIAADPQPVASRTNVDRDGTK
jgi:hypothetical protein